MGSSPGSVYDQSANMLQGAGGLFNRAANMVGGSDGLFNPHTISGNTGYKPATMAAAAAASPNTIASGMSRYMNPYTDTVINRASTDVQRMIDQNLAQVGGGASAAGAFGGSRHGLLEGQVFSEGQKNIGDLSANLRNTGWNNAASLAGQDILNLLNNNQFNAGLLQQAFGANQNAKNTSRQFGATMGYNQDLANQAAINAAKQGKANYNLQGSGILGSIGQMMQGLGQTGYNIGSDITSSQQKQGSLQQALAQAILGGAAGQYEQFTGSPANSLSMQLQALGMNPLKAATTTTGSTTPGLFDWASMAAQLAGDVMGGWGDLTGGK